MLTDMACRLDVWLYRARFYKTRSLAARAVSSGKIRITRHDKTERIKKPHGLIRSGEMLTFMRGAKLIQVKMIGPGTRRGPASEARTLYEMIEGEDQPL